jgi:hypothetical protein
MLPAAPDRFSMGMGCPSNSDIRFTTIRATRSVAPPGAKGTITLTQRLGQSCADAGIDTAMASTAAIRLARIRMDFLLISVDF